MYSRRWEDCTYYLSESTIASYANWQISGLNGETGSSTRRPGKSSPPWCSRFHTGNIFHVSRYIVILHVAIKFVNSTFRLVRWRDVAGASFDTLLNLLREVLSKLTTLRISIIYHYRIFTGVLNREVTMQTLFLQIFGLVAFIEQKKTPRYQWQSMQNPWWPLHCFGTN